MEPANPTISANSIGGTIRLFLVFSLLLIVPLALNLTSWIYLVACLLLATGFIFLRDKLWWLLYAALPALTLGQVLHLEVRPGWIYEMTLTEALLLAAAAIFVADGFMEKKLADLKIDSISIVMALYLVYAVSSFFRVTDLHFFAGEIKVIFFSLLAYLLAINLITDDKKRKGILLSLIVTAAILSVQLFFVVTGQGFSAKLFYDRSAILLPVGAIALVSAILAFLLPLFLSYFFFVRPEEKIKPYLLVVFWASLAAIALTMSKAAILSLTLGLVYLFIKLEKKRVAILLLFGSFIVLGFIALQPFFTGLVERVSNAVVDKNTRFRIDEYRISWEIIKDNWQLGVGVGEQPRYFERELDFEYRNLVNNFFVQSLIDLGVLGLFLVLLLVRKLRHLTIKLMRRAAGSEDEMIMIFGLIGSLIAAAMNGLFEVTFFALPFALLFWPAVGAFKYKILPLQRGGVTK